MNTRHHHTFLSLIVAGACLAACYLAFTASADTPNAGKAKGAVEAAEGAVNKAKGAADVAMGEGLAAAFGTKYPDTDEGRAAQAADQEAQKADAAADAAEKEAAKAALKFCRSKSADDKKAADKAEQAAKDAEDAANAADKAADTTDRKADPNGKQLQKKARDADKVLRALHHAAIPLICFARQCAEMLDESSATSKKRKQETLDKIDGLENAVQQFAFAAPQGGNGKVETAQGLRRVTFDTKNGRVTVNLPDDMRAGDTISGTVIAEPKGQNDDDRKTNMDQLSGLVIDITTPRKPDGTDGTNVKATVSAAPVPFTIFLPLPPAPTPVGPSMTDTVVVRLTNTNGSSSVGGTTSVPIEIISLHLQSVAPIQVPTIGQQGRPIEIIGPFDGNASNTKLMYGPARSSVQDFEKNTENVTGGFGLLQPLAESPRKTVFRAPTNVTGPIELFVKDVKAETVAPYRNVGVNLTAPKTNLIKGEHTELQVEVNGLQGIKEPVPLTLESHGVITMEGGIFQPLVIQPSQVGADGRYTTTRGITGIQTGVWDTKATVVTLPPYILLRDPSPPRQLLINSRTGHYDFCGGPGEKFSGDGQVKADGCSFYFFQSSNEEVLIGVLNACNFNNRYWVFAGGLPSLTVDLRVKVDFASPPRTRVYFNPLGRPAPPVQDVSAFATCP